MVSIDNRNIDIVVANGEIFGDHELHGGSLEDGKGVWNLFEAVLEWVVPAAFESEVKKVDAGLVDVEALRDSVVQEL
jgi:hypothetical protein